MKPKKKSVLLVLHGAKSSDSLEKTADFVTKLQKLLGKKHMSAAYLRYGTPLPKEALEKLYNQGFRKIVIVPLFISPGSHTLELQEISDNFEREHQGIEISIQNSLIETPGFLDFVKGLIA